MTKLLLIKVIKIMKRKFVDLAVVLIFRKRKWVEKIKKWSKKIQERIMDGVVAEEEVVEAAVVQVDGVATVAVEAEVVVEAVVAAEVEVVAAEVEVVVEAEVDLELFNF